MDRSVVVGVPPVVCRPSSYRSVVVRVPHLGALVVVEVPSCVVSDHLGFNIKVGLIQRKNLNINLVVVVVEELRPLAGPDISQQRVVDVESAEGVSAHDGHHLLSSEAEVLLEELDGLLAVAHDIRMDLTLGGDVRPELVLRDTVRTTCPGAGVLQYWGRCLRG